DAAHVGVRIRALTEGVLAGEHDVRAREAREFEHRLERRWRQLRRDARTAELVGLEAGLAEAEVVEADDELRQPLEHAAEQRQLLRRRVVPELVAAVRERGEQRERVQLLRVGYVQVAEREHA